MGRDVIGNPRNHKCTPGNSTAETRTQEPVISITPTISCMHLHVIALVATAEQTQGPAWSSTMDARLTTQPLVVRALANTRMHLNNASMVVGDGAEVGDVSNLVLHLWHSQ